MAKKKSDSGGVLRSAERLLLVLEWFCREEPEGSVSRIAADLGIAPSTIRRILLLLEGHRFVIRTKRNTYRIGMAPLQLADAGRRANPQLEAAHFQVGELQSATGETASLIVRDGAYFVHLGVKESAHSLRVHTPVGQRRFLDIGGSGARVLLAWADEEIVQLWKDEYAATRDSAEGPAAEWVRAQELLEQVRKDGYAVNRGTGFDPSTWAVAAPICDQSGAVIAALCVGAPLTRVARREDEERLIAATLRLAREASNGVVPGTSPSLLH